MRFRLDQDERTEVTTENLDKTFPLSFPPTGWEGIIEEDITCPLVIPLRSKGETATNTTYHYYQILRIGIPKFSEEDT